MDAPSRGLAAEQDSRRGGDPHHGTGLMRKLGRAGAAGADLAQERVQAQDAYPPASRTTAQMIATPSTVVAVVQRLG